MTRIKIIIYVFMILGFTECNNTIAEKKKTDNKPVITEVNIKQTITENQLATKKDPVCGMPAYKFLKDTTLFENKIYGFCGKGCKDEFLKTPKIFSTK